LVPQVWDNDGAEETWPCVNSPENFCYICRHFVFKSQYFANTCSEEILVLQFWMSCGRLKRNLCSTIMLHYTPRKFDKMAEREKGILCWLKLPWYCVKQAAMLVSAIYV